MVKEEKTRTYVLVTNDWNNGLSEEEILKKYSICKSTLASYLSKARKNGILIMKREKFEGNKAQENAINESRTNKIQVEEPNHNREEIKELLKTFLPRQVAKRLKISTKIVFDVMDSLNSEERKELPEANFAATPENVYMTIINCRIRISFSLIFFFSFFSSIIIMLL